MMSAEYLQFGYKGDWPTYRRLTYFSPQGGLRLIYLCAGHCILWDRGALLSKRTRGALGTPEDVPTESFFPAMVEAAKLERAAGASCSLQRKRWWEADRTAVILPESPGKSG